MCHPFPRLPLRGLPAVIDHPFFFRMVMVIPPLFDIISKFGGDAKWFIARIREIRVKGLGLLILNEILALLLPFLLAVYARTKFRSSRLA